MTDMDLIRDVDTEFLIPIKGYSINQLPGRTMNNGPIEWKIVFGSSTAGQVLLSRYMSLPLSFRMDDRNMMIRSWMPSRPTPIEHPSNRQMSNVLNRITQSAATSSINLQSDVVKSHTGDRYFVEQHQQQSIGANNWMRSSIHPSMLHGNQQPLLGTPPFDHSPPNMGVHPYLHSPSALTFNPYPSQ